MLRRVAARAPCMPRMACVPHMLRLTHHAPLELALHAEHAPRGRARPGKAGMSGHACHGVCPVRATLLLLSFKETCQSLQNTLYVRMETLPATSVIIAQQPPGLTRHRARREAGAPAPRTARRTRIPQAAP